MMYYNPHAGVQVNGKPSEAFMIECSVWQRCPCLFSMSLLWSLCSLGDIPYTGPLSAKVATYADVFVSHRLDIKTVKKAVARYEQITGPKINFDKSEGLWLGAWRSGVPLPEPFRRRDGSITILRVRFEPGLHSERNWSEVQAKGDALVGIWLRRRLFLKGGAEVCAVNIFP